VPLFDADHEIDERGGVVAIVCGVGQHDDAVVEQEGGVTVRAPQVRFAGSIEPHAAPAVHAAEPPH
jgi:hypothetical protein